VEGLSRQFYQERRALTRLIYGKMDSCEFTRFLLEWEPKAQEFRSVLCIYKRERNKPDEYKNTSEKFMECQTGTPKPVIRCGGRMRSLEYTGHRTTYACSAINSITHYFGRTDFALWVGDLYERWTMQLRHQPPL